MLRRQRLSGHDARRACSGLFLLSPELDFVVANHVHNPSRVTVWQEDNSVARVEASFPEFVVGTNRLEMEARRNGVLDQLLKRIFTLGLSVRTKASKALFEAPRQLERGEAPSAPTHLPQAPPPFFFRPARWARTSDFLLIRVVLPARISFKASLIRSCTSECANQT